MQGQGGDELAELRRSVRNNPASRSYYYAALAHAECAVEFDQLAAVVARTPAPATCTVHPKNAVTNLVNKGALEQTITVNGEPYAGSYEDLLHDESIRETDEVTYWVQRSEKGTRLLDELNPRTRAEELLLENPDFAAAYAAVMELCVGEGVSKTRVEALLRADPQALRIDERTGLETIAPVFYLTNLEDRGALEWSGGLWKTTEAGAAALAKWSEQASE